MSGEDKAEALTGMIRVLRNPQARLVSLNLSGDKQRKAVKLSRSDFDEIVLALVVGKGARELCFKGLELTGEVPVTFADVPGLVKLDLRENGFSGRLPLRLVARFARNPEHLMVAQNQYLGGLLVRHQSVFSMRLADGFVGSFAIGMLFTPGIFITAILALLKLNGDRPTWSWVTVVLPLLVAQPITFLTTFPAHVAALSLRSRLSTLVVVGNYFDRSDGASSGAFPGMHLAMQLDFAMTAVTGDLLIGALYAEGRLAVSSLTIILAPCWILSAATLIVLFSSKHDHALVGCVTNKQENRGTECFWYNILLATPMLELACVSTALLIIPFLALKSDGIISGSVDWKQLSPGMLIVVPFLLVWYRLHIKVYAVPVMCVLTLICATVVCAKILGDLHAGWSAVFSSVFLLLGWPMALTVVCYVSAFLIGLLIAIERI